MTVPPVVVDCAGGAVGGARRFLDELDGYLAAETGRDVTVVGRDRSLSASWLVRREWQQRDARRSVALNNVAFSRSGRQRWVLLRNALHFLTPAETEDLGARLPRHVRMQIPVVHRTALRADVVVAPSSSMRERIAATLPSLAGRTVVRPHPTSPLPGTHRRQPGTFLCPVVFLDYKRMSERLTHLVAAAGLLATRGPEPIRLLVTATPGELAATGVPPHPALEPIGHLSTGDVQRTAARCSAVVYPTRIESFGYPLAEARVNRWPVIAPGTAHHREIAGDALVPYESETPDELADAMGRAMTTVLPAADADDLDPRGYFDWLLGRTVP